MDLTEPRSGPFCKDYRGRPRHHMEEKGGCQPHVILRQRVRQGKQHPPAEGCWGSHAHRGPEAPLSSGVGMVKRSVMVHGGLQRTVLI